MKIVCAPKDVLGNIPVPGLGIILFGPGPSSVGARIPDAVRKQKLVPVARAWDLLSIALSVFCADQCVRRKGSPDGWTRELDLEVAVDDPEFWNSQKELIIQQLQFLTTDIWNVAFFQGNPPFESKVETICHRQDSVVLLSGGLDSLIGAIDIVHAHDRNPYAVSQVVQGSKRIQKTFSSSIGNGLTHLQLNHNAKHVEKNELSQRSRSIVFLAYGVLVATALSQYCDGGEVTLYIPENGFISLNPPLTDARIGSLSTRTTHPFFVRLFQQLLLLANIRVRLVNPYQFMTKGEMIRNCSMHSVLQQCAPLSTSCGRYTRHGYKHCGRCVPCLIRRAAFLTSDLSDSTQYVYPHLSQDDKHHARFDDVRSAAMAVISVESDGA